MKYLSIALSLLMAACSPVGSMLPGNMISSRGHVLDFAIEKAYRSGKVTAHNPASNETFSGNYVGILGSGDLGTATAYLKGDKGTLIHCRMKIEPGLSPHGLGACEDQKGAKYRVQF